MHFAMQLRRGRNLGLKGGLVYRVEWQFWSKNLQCQGPALPHHSRKVKGIKSKAARGPGHQTALRAQTWRQPT
jgi:hypothetical protein